MRSDVHPRLADAALALALTLVLAVVIASDPDGNPSIGAYAFAVGFGAVLFLRRRMPRTVLVLTVLAIMVYYALNLPPVGTVLPVVGALFSAAELRHTFWAIGTAAALLIISTYFRLNEGEVGDAVRGYTLVTELALAAAAIALGATVRLSREARERTARIAELTEAEQVHVAENRMQAERMSIARDLHDTIGHTLSVAALHAGVASEAVGHDDAAARAALERVRTATSETLRELRRTVKVLRADTTPAASVLGIAALAPIVDAAAETGLRVTTDLAVEPDSLSRSVDAAAYRIVQEALTNVIRHARATTVDVTARVADGTLAVRIGDDGHEADARGMVEGAGIRGMRERAETLGGSLTASATSAGFVVAAEIPAHAEGTT